MDLKTGEKVIVLKLREPSDSELYARVLAEDEGEQIESAAVAHFNGFGGIVFESDS